MRSRLLVLLAFLLVATGCTVSESVVVGEPGPALRVLFVGNSYTFGHDLPDHVESIAKANAALVDADMYAIGGATLSDHQREADVREMISSGDFDVVILQEQSMTPALPRIFALESTPAARDLADLARAAGAGVVLFQTWGHAEGNDITGHKTYGAMQAQIIASYGRLGESLGAQVAPVGVAWREAMVLAPDVELHDADLSHPSPAGTYLAALVFADLFVAGQLSEAPDGLVDSATADALLQVVNSLGTF